MADKKLPKIPAKRGQGRVPTLTPARLGGVASALLLGDTVKAACATALVPQPTFTNWMQRGQLALDNARSELETDDIEGLFFDWIEEHGGFGTGDAKQWYWTSDPADWWPESLANRWLHCVFVIVVTWARGRAEQMYRTSITKAANGTNGQPADWRAAQFMLTHSFGWQSADKIEVSGQVDVNVSQDQVLTALAVLAEKRKVIEQ